MHWYFVAAAALALAFTKLGAMSVWVSVLAVSLKIVLVVALGIAVLFGGMYLWRRFKMSDTA